MPTVLAEAALLPGDMLAFQDCLPPVYVNGFPKAGLHMTEQAVSAIAAADEDNTWLGSFQGNGFSTEWQDIDSVVCRFEAIRPGHYMKGHAGFTPEIADAMRERRTAHIFIFRDLRDVVVSQAFHILNTKNTYLKHAGRDLYAGLDLEGVMRAVIEGRGAFGGIIERWEQYAGWLDQPWIFPVRYEQMRHHAKPVCAAMLEYVLSMGAARMEWPGIELSHDTYDMLVMAMLSRSRDTGQSRTFRKGKPGGWRDHFTPDTVACFKEYDPGWLVGLGFEDDDTWQA